ncbi:uncharacterized protein SOCE26_056130 [Sorangium cellulosum]|uniref:Uncharacterized protein n=1 Tax=Sorangium cellulosum TaxID=56 RepID=A0A2L0EXX7_SORCE|nr:uncharacterized protein SOCE26_056130 [Sorangium cellulosum]
MAPRSVLDRAHPRAAAHSPPPALTSSSARRSVGGGERAASTRIRPLLPVLPEHGAVAQGSVTAAPGPKCDQASARTNRASKSEEPYQQVRGAVPAGPRSRTSKSEEPHQQVRGVVPAGPRSRTSRSEESYQQVRGAVPAGPRSPTSGCWQASRSCWGVAGRRWEGAERCWQAHRAVLTLAGCPLERGAPRPPSCKRRGERRRGAVRGGARVGAIEHRPRCHKVPAGSASQARPVGRASKRLRWRGPKGDMPGGVPMRKFPRPSLGGWRAPTRAPPRTAPRRRVPPRPPLSTGTARAGRSRPRSCRARRAPGCPAVSSACRSASRW